MDTLCNQDTLLIRTLSLSQAYPFYVDYSGIRTVVYVLVDKLCNDVFIQAWVVSYKRFGRAANVPFLLLLLASVIVSQCVVFSVVFDLQLPPVGRMVCSTQQVWGG